MNKTNYQPYKKKGQMLGAVQAVIALIAGVGVSTLVLIFVGALGGQTYNLIEPSINNIGLNSTGRATFTGSNSTVTSLGNPSVYNGSVVVTNSTGFNIPIGNFTVDYTAGTIRLANGPVPSTFNGQTLTANYNYNDPSVRNDVKGGIKSSFEALRQTGDYLPIIVLAIVISLVLALVLGMTGSVGGNGGNSNTAL